MAAEAVASRLERQEEDVRRLWAEVQRLRAEQLSAPERCPAEGPSVTRAVAQLRAENRDLRRHLHRLRLSLAAEPSRRAARGAQVAGGGTPGAAGGAPSAPGGVRATLRVSPRRTGAPWGARGRCLPSHRQAPRGHSLSSPFKPLPRIFFRGRNSIFLCLEKALECLEPCSVLGQVGVLP